MVEQIQETPQSTQPSQSVPVEPKKKSSLPKIAILLVVILLLAGGVYAGMQLEKKKVKVWTEPPLTEEPTETPPDGTVKVFTETIAPKPSGVSDETASWKTYTNEKYGFEFKYPPLMEVKSNPGGLSENILEWVDIDDSSKEEGSAYRRFGLISVWNNPRGLSLQEIQKEIDEAGPIPGGSMKFYQEGAPTMVVSGKKAVVLGPVDCAPFACPTRIVVLDGKRIYVIHHYWEENKILFDQILSTFKFFR